MMDARDWTEVYAFTNLAGNIAIKAREDQIVIKDGNCLALLHNKLA